MKKWWIILIIIIVLVIGAYFIYNQYREFKRERSWREHECISDDDCVVVLGSCPYGFCGYVCTDKKHAEKILSEECSPNCTEEYAGEQKPNCFCGESSVFDFKICRSGPKTE